MDTVTPEFRAAKHWAACKERLIESALDRYFKQQAWSEEVVEKHCAIDVLPDGTETFRIKDTELIQFDPVEWNYVVEGMSTKITIRQSYTVLQEQ